MRKNAGGFGGNCGRPADCNYIFVRGNSRLAAASSFRDGRVQFAAAASPPTTAADYEQQPRSHSDDGDGGGGDDDDDDAMVSSSAAFFTWSHFSTSPSSSLSTPFFTTPLPTLDIVPIRILLFAAGDDADKVGQQHFTATLFRRVMISKRDNFNPVGF